MTEISILSDVSAQELVAFERMLAQLSARLANIPVERFVSEAQTAQVLVREFLGFDRSSFAEFKQDGSLDVLSTTAVAGVDAVSLGTYRPEFNWYHQQLLAGEIIAWRASDPLPPEAGAEAEYVRNVNLRAQLSIPLRVAGKIVAIIGFASFHETPPWPEHLIARLTLVGNVFALALARKRQQEALSAALSEVSALKDRLSGENRYLQVARSGPLARLTSHSERFRSVIEEASQVAQTNSTVLLLGETGSGKEVLAQAIHDASARAARPMIKVNCAALPASLIESELFGREKGAFTGALARQPGRFEVADGSTIFLDEVGELPLELQPKLLRVLQEGEFERLGGAKTISVNTRVIAATNRQLERAVKEGKFREDLYYRLCVFPIEVPPLRERREDIPMLSWTFVKEFNDSMGKRVDEIADESMTALREYQWPGNVRELRNVIERAMILGNGPTLHIKLAQTTPRSHGLTATAGSLNEAERSIILLALEQCNWRIRGTDGAAALLDMKPTTLESRIAKLGLMKKR